MLTSRLSRWIDPAAAFAAEFAHEPNAFWLDSGVEATSGYSYMGAGLETITASVPAGTVTRGGVTRNIPVFDALDEAVAEAGPSAPAAGQFSPGWVGWIGYEAGAQTCGTPMHPSRYPDAALIRPQRMLVFDHEAKTVVAVVMSAGTGWADDIERRVADLEQAAPVIPRQTSVARWRHQPDRYADLIRSCQESIRRGDAYQLCLTNEIVVDGTFEPLEVFLRLRSGSPSHHGGLLIIDGIALVSSSPEQFLQVNAGGIATTRPIKGTRPRGESPVEDVQLRAELLASEKERAENLMIVDLMRNDLGRVCEIGSISVPELLVVESYAQVHQLVSTVRGRLASGVTGVRAAASCFPAGSMTGAPKLSAMSIVNQLESGPRGIYSGIFGFFGADGAVDLAMVIRSIVIDSRGASIGTGGGITALSVPAEEVEETRVKARALLAALGLVG